MPPRKSKQYSDVRFWRYIFTPLFLLGLFAGIFLLFTVPDTQFVSYDVLTNQVARLISPSAPPLNNISAPH